MSDPLSVKGHSEYTFQIELRGWNANWSGQLDEVKVWATSLQDALHQAAALPLTTWFGDEEEEDARESVH